MKPSLGKHFQNQTCCIECNNTCVICLSDVSLAQEATECEYLSLFLATQFQLFISCDWLINLSHYKRVGLYSMHFTKRLHTCGNCKIWGWFPNFFYLFFTFCCLLCHNEGQKRLLLGTNSCILYILDPHCFSDAWPNSPFFHSNS